MAATLLCESGGALRVAESGKWSATLISPGAGSSGIYSEDMLAECAATAFPKGTKLWFGHPKEGEGPGDRDARDQWGVLDEAASFEPGEGIVGKIRLLPHWKEVVESLGDQASLSIYAMGEADKDGNVTALLESATNSIDIVGYPGRPGSGLKKKLEAARAASVQPGSTSAPDHTQEEHMDELKAAVEALTSTLTTFLAEQKAAADAARQAEADAEANEKDVTAAVEAAVESLKAIADAKLVAELEAPLVEAAKRGEDIAASLEQAKKVQKAVEAAIKPATAGAGYVHESAAAAEDITLGIGGRR